jgi:hypothetical protein
MIGAIASTGSTQPDGITFGNDVECGSFLIIDQHTFEGRYTLPGHNAPFSYPIS